MSLRGLLVVLFGFTLGLVDRSDLRVEPGELDVVLDRVAFTTPEDHGAVVSIVQQRRGRIAKLAGVIQQIAENDLQAADPAGRRAGLVPPAAAIGLGLAATSMPTTRRKTTTKKW